MEVVPVIIGALGSVTNDLERWIRKLGIAYNNEEMQKLPCWELQEYCGKCKNFREMNILLAYGHLL